MPVTVNASGAFPATLVTVTFSADEGASSSVSFYLQGKNNIFLFCL